MTNILTDQEARRAVGRGVQDASKDDLLAIANTAVTTMLEDYCGPVVYSTITAELHNGGGNRIYLNQYPVVSVTQVVTYDNTTASTLTAESNTSKPSAGYNVNLNSGALTARDQNADTLFPVGRDNVRVTYVAGRFATQGSITQKWKLAAELTLKNVWRAWENNTATLGEYEVPQASFPTFSVPTAVKQLLAKEWHAGSGVGD